MHLASITWARRHALLAVATLLVAGCSSATGVRDLQVQVRRDAWTGEKLTSYEYDYELGPTWFIAFSGRWIHLVVRDDAVQSATDVATGQAMPEPLETWPTIDRLFDEAETAAASGALKSITYDSQYGYPTAMDLAGPPDASGRIYAANLSPLP